MSKAVIEVLIDGRRAGFVGETAARFDLGEVKILISHPIAAVVEDAMSFDDQEAAQVFVDLFEKAASPGQSFRATTPQSSG